MTPLEVRLVLTREAATVLGCSMRQVLALAAAGTLKSWSLGPTSFAYDLEELKRYKAEKEAGPQFFKPDVGPWQRARRPLE
jgi:hypothetical protein